MKTLSASFIALACIVMLSGLSGCKTSEPGVKNTLGNLSTTVIATPPQTARAAETVLKDLELLRIAATSTEIDGEVFGYTASGKKINVSIKAAGEANSAIWVRVGTLGDEDLGLTIIKKIEDELGAPKSK